MGKPINVLYKFRVRGGGEIVKKARDASLLFQPLQLYQILLNSQVLCRKIVPATWPESRGKSFFQMIKICAAWLSYHSMNG